MDGVTEQDKKIAGYAHEAGKGMLIVVNKWDAIAKDDKTMQKNSKRTFGKKWHFCNMHLSSIFLPLTGQRVDRIFHWVDYIAQQQSMRIPTSRLNEVFGEALRLNPPPTDKGRRLKLYYGTQVWDQTSEICHLCQ